MICREGANRVVLLLYGWAIKLPRLRAWRCGLANNRNEYRWQGEHPSYCPVLRCAPFGLFAIMPRASALTDAEFATLDAHLPALPGAERKASSWGWFNGRVVAIDYGWR